MPRPIDKLLFIGLSGRVLALDRDDGRLVWEQKIRGGLGGYVSVMLDGDRVVAVGNGYVQAMDPVSGRVLWHNPLKGKGMGVASITSVRGSTDGALGASEQAAMMAAST